MDTSATLPWGCWFLGRPESVLPEQTDIPFRTHCTNSGGEMNQMHEEKKNTRESGEGWRGGVIQSI